MTINSKTERFSPELRTRALVEALPYIQRFRGKTVVVKLGGNAMVDHDLFRTFAEDIVLLRSVGIKPVVVHGGGPQIGDLLGRLGKESEFRNGLRVTDAETLDIVRMVLVGKVGRDIVGQINAHGPYAVGLSGEDGRLIQAETRDPELGFVGDVAQVDTTMVDRLLAEDLIPVVSSIGSGSDGQAFNINADTVAGALGGALGSEKVLFLTDVAGLLGDRENPESLIAQISIDELETALKKDIYIGGMVPKLRSCVEAIKAGADSAHLLDGRIPHVLLLELFTDSGIGTMVSSSAITGEGRGVRNEEPFGIRRP